MKMMSGGRSFPSYRFPWKHKDYTDAYKIQWEVESKVGSRSKKYVSIRSLSIMGAEVICGRATIVLEVVSYDDYVNKNENVSHWLSVNGILCVYDFFL
jgi:hypothetical protein